MLKNIIFVLLLCCAPATLFFGPSTMKVDAKQPEINPVEIKMVSAQVGPLENEVVEMDNVCIKYKGTLLLSSQHPAFGGFSDILVSEDRKTFLAVSDLGFWLKADLKYSENGFLTGTSDSAKLGQLRDLNGETYPIKYSADAEGLSRAPGSGYLISFERIHRIHKFANGQELSLRGTPEIYEGPADLKNLPDNSGIESILTLQDQRVFILSEGDDKFSPLSYAAIQEDGKWLELTYQRSDEFRPTSAANLPDGKIAVLERKYNGPGTLGIRVRTFSVGQIVEKAKITPSTLFSLQSSLPIDNFEGLDTITTKDGNTFIYIISDDNFSPLQHTLISLFELQKSEN